MSLSGKTKVIPSKPTAEWLIFYLQLFPEYSVRVTSTASNPVSYMIIDHDAETIYIHGE